MGALSQGQKKYNYHLSMARVVSENAFGRLKGCWRCLLKRIDMVPEHVPVLIIACCTLHNICELHGDEFNSDWLSDHGANASAYDDEDSGTSRNATPSATNIRCALVEYFDQL